MDRLVEGHTYYRHFSKLGSAAYPVCFLSHVRYQPEELIFAHRYNSTIFATESINRYRIVGVPESFVTSKTPYNSSDWGTALEEVEHERYMYENSRRWERLEPLECLRAYSKSFLHDRHDVLLITEMDKDTINLYPKVKNNIRRPHWEWAYTDYITARYRNFEFEYVVKQGNWTLYGRDIHYCISEPYETKCTLQYNRYIMLAVIISNLMVIGVMVWTRVKLDDDRDGLARFVTVGDAINSFLQTPDPETERMSAVAVRQIANPLTGPGRRSWDYTEYYRGSAVPIGLWGLSGFL